MSCAICKEKSYNPLTLHCLHSLCKDCFEGNVREQLPDVCDLNSDVLLFCPLCDYQSSCDISSYLQRNIGAYLAAPQAIKALLDIEHGLDSPICLSCKNKGKTTSSLFWCFDCVNHFCEECFDFHSTLPVLDKHKTYSLAELKKDPDVVTKAREICEEHGLRLTKFCSERECVCCDGCLSSDHIDICKGEHKKIQEEIISKLVNPKVTELQESLRNMLQNLDSNGKELSDVENKTEEFFKDEQMKADEKSNNLRKRLLESSDSILVESYKIPFYKLQEMESTNAVWKQQKSILENAIDLLSALKGGSDLRYFLELKKIKQVLKQAGTILDDCEKGGKTTFSVLFEKSLDTFADLDSFGKITEIQYMSNEENSAFGSIDDSFDKLQSRDSKGNLPSMQAEKSFFFGEHLFRLSKSIDLENGKSHVTGCDWMSENEIVIVDQKVKGSPDFCVYNTENGKLKSRIPLDQKPYDISVLPNNQCAITFPKEEEVRVYSLIDYSVQRELDVDIKCYGVCHCFHPQGGITMVAGEDNIIFYDKNFSETKCLTVDGEDIRYICAYNNNLIFYSDIKTNTVYSVIGNGDNRFEYTDDDSIKGAAGLIIDESKNVYVCEKGEDCIHVLNKSGDFIRKIEVGQNPTSISLSRSKTKICIIRGGRHTLNVAEIYTL